MRSEQLGSRSGVPVLLSTLEKFFPGAPLGAFYLSKFGIEEAAPILDDILRRWDFPSDPTTSAGLLRSRFRLRQPPPDSLRKLVEGVTDADLWPPYLLADVKELAGQHAAANSEGTSISLDQEPH